MTIPGARGLKSIGRSFVCSILEKQVVQLRQRHNFTVVAVVGSVGKTSTKAAVAQVLSAAKPVRYQSGNYNDRVTVPLLFFGEPLPALWNILAWLGIFRRNKKQIRQANFPYDYVVLELGTDEPGDISEFAYTKPEIAVVTALTPEHMSQFKTLQGVVTEELSVLKYSAQGLINIDESDPKDLQGITTPYKTYSMQDAKADFFATSQDEAELRGQSLRVTAADNTLQVHTALLGSPGAKAVLAAVAVATLLGIEPELISRGVADLPPFPGRLQRLNGIEDSMLIDDTYNSSPAAVSAALNVLESFKAPQRIAILGSMNQMGDMAESAHQEVGSYCDPAQIDYVVTVGRGANTWLAPAARQRGCKVQECNSPHQAGAFVASILKPKAVVLAKGSQDGVYAEEALKPLLRDSADQVKLVRQSPYWLAIKRKQFSDI